MTTTIAFLDIDRYLRYSVSMNLIFSEYKIVRLEVDNKIWKTNYRDEYDRWRVD